MGSRMHRSRLALRAGSVAVVSSCTFFLAVVNSPASVTKNPSNPESLIAVGKAIFHDKTLSEPKGMACVTCHDPSTGYSYPISLFNATYGTVPGAVRGRGGDRKPPSAAYAPFMPAGLPHYDQTALAWVGGLFWDGRAKDALEQARFPFLNPNEMNNRSHGLQPGAIVVQKIQSGPYSHLFKSVFGQDIFSRPVAIIFEKVAEALVAYEASDEVSPFTSKYDAYLEGKAELTSQELLGLRLATGTIDGRPGSLPFRKSAHCTDCHALSTDLTKSKDIWTNSCYANLGVPRNPMNLVNFSAKKIDNKLKSSGSMVDLGLGGFLYPYLGFLPGALDYGDPLRINGAFKAPTLRNVDKRPYPQFVKSYMHNGAFKSLKEVVHFYNTRNLTTHPGEVIDFAKPNPYAGLKGKPIWNRPEYLNPQSLINPTGTASGLGSRNAQAPPVLDLDAMQIGNLLLSEQQEDAIVAFMKTLSDGYFKR